MWFKSYDQFYKLVTDGQTDGLTVIIVHTCESCNLETLVLNAICNIYRSSYETPVAQHITYDRFSFIQIPGTPCADPEGETAGPDPLKNHKFIGFSSNTGPDPLKITKLPNQHSTVGHYRPASETPFQWRFAGRPVIFAFGGLWSLAPLKKCQSWTPSDKTLWIRAWIRRFTSNYQQFEYKEVSQ